MPSKRKTQPNNLQQAMKRYHSPLVRHTAKSKQMVQGAQAKFPTKVLNNTKENQVKNIARILQSRRHMTQLKHLLNTLNLAPRNRKMIVDLLQQKPNFMTRLKDHR